MKTNNFLNSITDNTVAWFLPRPKGTWLPLKHLDPLVAWYNPEFVLQNWLQQLIMTVP